MEVRDWVFDEERLNGGELVYFGRTLDQRPEKLHGRTVAMELAERLLKVRTRSGNIAALKANRVQRAFERNRGQHNIVLKARQLGLTTWTAARFFLKTIMQPGTLTLQVAHTMDSAEEIFRIVHRFLDYMPSKLRKGCLRTSQDNARQIVFPQLESQYCRNAANVLEQAAASVSALWAGTYKCTRVGLDADVWPGDALQMNLSSASLNAKVFIRAVSLSYTASLPDVVHYAIDFANDWADGLAIKTSETVPDDAWLPAAIAPTYAPNLGGLTIIAMNGADVTINTGATAPMGGGFEIRRCDNCFMPGTDTDLVMRSSQPTMTFQRMSASDRFYIRAYDGSNPPNYSEFSAALIFNLPLAS